MRLITKLKSFHTSHTVYSAQEGHGTIQFDVYVCPYAPTPLGPMGSAPHYLGSRARQWTEPPNNYDDKKIKNY